jgi:hypothetical protein
MTRAVSIAVAAVALLGAPLGCGDTQGIVIERTARSIDGGGGSGGACSGPGCTQTGGAPAGECNTNADCTNPGKALCNTTLHTCAECVTDADCGDPPETCSVALGRCAAPCSSDADCAADDPRCDLAVGHGTTPGYCVGCRAVSDCTNPDRPFCVEGDCVACANGQC